MLIFALISAICTQAEAAAITNLTPHEQVFELEEGNGFVRQAVAPGATWRVHARVWVRFGARAFLMGENEEYAIWNDGEIGPQRSNARGVRSF
jgi:hypothetical protein